MRTEEIERVLVLVAHSDDETLGCGGTIARHAESGAAVDVIIVADGVTSRAGDEAARSKIEQRFDAARAACRALGAKEPQFLGFPDQKLDQHSMLDIIRAVEARATVMQPQVVYTHFCGDLNADHRIVCRAALTAFRPVPGSATRAIYGFEVLSSTEWAFGSEPCFAPNHFVEITGQMRRKSAALSHYELEMRPFPHPRSLDGVEALARMRGATVGVEAAEAFVVYREVR